MEKRLQGFVVGGALTRVQVYLSWDKKSSICTRSLHMRQIRGVTRINGKSLGTVLKYINHHGKLENNYWRYSK